MRPETSRRTFLANSLAAGAVTSTTAAPLLVQAAAAPVPPAERAPASLRLKPRYHRWHVDPGVEWVETNTAYATLDWTIPLSQTALVLVDVWDRHYLRDTEARAEAVIADTLVPLLTACRSAGMPIVHAPSPPQADRHPNRLTLEPPASRPTTPRDDWPPPAFRSKSGPFQAYRRPNEPREPELAKLRAGIKIHPKVEPIAGEPVVATGEELHRYCKQQGILFLFFAVNGPESLRG